jgi:hypothetical protein
MVKRFNCSNGEALKSKTYKHPVTILTSSSVVEIGSKGEVVVMDSSFNKSVIQVDNVVLSKVEPETTFYDELLAVGVVVTKIGDLKQVRNLHHAVKEGANTGLLLNRNPQLNGNNEVISDLPTGVNLG